MSRLSRMRILRILCLAKNAKKTHSLAKNAYSLAKNTHSLAKNTHSLAKNTHSLAKNTHSLANAFFAKEYAFFAKEYAFFATSYSEVECIIICMAILLRLHFWVRTPLLSKKWPRMYGHTYFWLMWIHTNSWLMWICVWLSPWIRRARGGGLGSSTIFKKFNEPYAPS